MPTFVSAGPFAEKAGWVYAYSRKADQDRLGGGCFLHKVGLTRRKPSLRVSEQERANKERYTVVAATPSRFPAFLEGHVHRYLAESRVTKLAVDGTATDGGTEWFLVRQTRLKEALAVFRLLAAHVWADHLP